MWNQALHVEAAGQIYVSVRKQRRKCVSSFPCASLCIPIRVPVLPCKNDLPARLFFVCIQFVGRDFVAAPRTSYAPQPTIVLQVDI